MVHRVPMVARRLAVPILLACGAFAGAQAAPPGSSSAQTDTQSQAGGTSSSAHRKTGANTGQTTHHTTVAEEVAPPPGLTRAEELIQERDYAGAEPMLRKVVGEDPANYVAWFDLGFAENGLGKIDDS